MGEGVTAPVAIGIGIGVFLIVIFILFFNPQVHSAVTVIDVARSNATVQEIFQGREHLVTNQYEGIMSIPDYECHIGMCVMVTFSPAAEPEKQAVSVYVNKDSMKVVEIRLSEDYLITKANESAEGKLFLAKYPEADVSAILGYWHPEVTYTILDESHSLQMFVNMTHAGEITGASVVCESHLGKVDRMTTGVSEYIDREVCPAYTS